MVSSTGLAVWKGVVTQRTFIGFLTCLPFLASRSCTSSFLTCSCSFFSSADSLPTVELWAWALCPTAVGFWDVILTDLRETSLVRLLANLWKFDWSSVARTLVTQSSKVPLVSPVMAITYFWQSTFAASGGCIAVANFVKRDWKATIFPSMLNRRPSSTCWRAGPGAIPWRTRA